MSDVRTIIQRLFTAFGQDATATTALPVPPGTPAELAGMYATAQVVSITKAVDGAPGTATANTLVYVNATQFPQYLISAAITAPAAGLTADAANFATIQVLTDNAAGGAPAAAAQRSTTIAAPGTGNWTAGVQVELLTAGTITAANSTARLIPSGGIVWYAITKSGTGVVVPISTISMVIGKF